MIQADEYPLWYFSHRPVPLRKAVALTLGPESYGNSPPFNKSYLLAKKDDQVALYRSLDGTKYTITADFPLPTHAIRNAYQGRFALALTPTHAIIAVQTGVLGPRGEPATIKVYAGTSEVYTVKGYDPQLVYSALLLDESLNAPECAVKLGAIILFYISPEGNKLVAEYLRPPYNVPSFRTEFSLSQPLQLISAIPTKGVVQLWFVNAKGEWIPAQFSAEVLQPRLSGEVAGPEVWGNPQSGEYAKLFSSTWSWRVDKQNSRFVFQKKDADLEYYIPTNHSLQEVCFAAVAFDGTGRPAIAYQIDSSTYVKYWNAAYSRYDTTPELPLLYPLMLQEATILSVKYPQATNVLLLGQNLSWAIVARSQNDGFTTERNLSADRSAFWDGVDLIWQGSETLYAFEKYLIIKDIELSSPLRYWIRDPSNTKVYQSDLYPYYDYTYRKANLPVPEYPPEHNFLVSLLSGNVNTRTTIHGYSSDSVIFANLNAASLNVKTLFTRSDFWDGTDVIWDGSNVLQAALASIPEYSSNASVNASLNQTSINLKTIYSESELWDGTDRLWDGTNTLNSRFNLIPEYANSSVVSTKLEVASVNVATVYSIDDLWDGADLLWDGANTLQAKMGNIPEYTNAIEIFARLDFTSISVRTVYALTDLWDGVNTLWDGVDALQAKEVI